GPPAAAARGGDPPYPPAAAARGGDPPYPPEKGGRPPFHPPPQGDPAQAAGSLGLPSRTGPDEALADPGAPPPRGTPPSPTTEAATLVAELRAILEPLLAAAGEGEEAW